MHAACHRVLLRSEHHAYAIWPCGEPGGSTLHPHRRGDWSRRRRPMGRSIDEPRTHDANFELRFSLLRHGKDISRKPRGGLHGPA